MAENESVARARQQLEVEREATNKSREEFMERMKGKPTPTQEENDLHALGATFLEHEEDGSGPDPFNQPVQGRHLEAKKPASSSGYQTRTIRPTPPTHG